MKQQLEELLKKWEAKQKEDDAIADRYLQLNLISNSDYYRGRVNRMSNCITDIKQIIQQAK